MRQSCHPPYVMTHHNQGNKKGSAEERKGSWMIAAGRRSICSAVFTCTISINSTAKFHWKHSSQMLQPTYLAYKEGLHMICRLVVDFEEQGAIAPLHEAAAREPVRQHTDACFYTHTHETVKVRQPDKPRAVSIPNHSGIF